LSVIAAVIQHGCNNTAFYRKNAALRNESINYWPEQRWLACKQHASLVHIEEGH